MMLSAFDRPQARQSKHAWSPTGVQGCTETNWTSFHATTSPSSIFQCLLSAARLSKWGDTWKCKSLSNGVKWRHPCQEGSDWHYVSTTLKYIFNQVSQDNSSPDEEFNMEFMSQGKNFRWTEFHLWYESNPILPVFELLYIAYKS